MQDVTQKHTACIHGITGESARANVLCELNVIEQVSNVCLTTIVRDAWERGQPLTVHSWIYGIKDGIMRDLGMAVQGPNEFESQYRASLAAIEAGRPVVADR